MTYTRIDLYSNEVILTLVKTFTWPDLCRDKIILTYAKTFTGYKCTFKS